MDSGDSSVATLAERLEARYPGVRIVGVYFSTTFHGDRQQTVRFQAPRELLLSSGLATERMLSGGGGTTELGCGFGHCPGLDWQSTPGCWDFFVYTGELPRDGRRLTKKGLRETAKLLKRIFSINRADA